MDLQSLFEFLMLSSLFGGGQGGGGGFLSDNFGAAVGQVNVQVCKCHEHGQHAPRPLLPEGVTRDRRVTRDRSTNPSPGRRGVDALGYHHTADGYVRTTEGMERAIKQGVPPQVVASDPNPPGTIIPHTAPSPST